MAQDQKSDGIERAALVIPLRAHLNILVAGLVAWGIYLLAIFAQPDARRTART